MDGYIPVDELQPTGRQRRPKRTISPLVWVAVTLVILVAGSFGVLAYLRHGNNASNTSSANLASTNGSSPQMVSGAPGGAGTMCTSSGQCSSGANMQAPITGTVTAVSSTSITIQPSGSSKTETFSITSSTGMGTPVTASNGAVQLQGEPFDASDIHVGESVAVQATSSSTQAQMVMLNPPQMTQ